MYLCGCIQCYTVMVFIKHCAVFGIDKTITLIILTFSIKLITVLRLVSVEALTPVGETHVIKISLAYTGSYNTTLCTFLQ